MISGDIRSAIFKLEYALNEKNVLPAANKDDAASTASTSDRHALDVFHALGKLLYAKRDPLTAETFITTENGLPAHLKHLARPFQLASNPDDVVDRCHLTGEKLSSFLHEDELDFAADLDSAQRILSDLSVFDACSKQ